MKKTDYKEIILYYIVGLLYPIGYSLLMSEYFGISPFEGKFIFISIYIAFCYIMYPFASIIVNKKTENKKMSWFLTSRTVLLLGFIFAPFIVVGNKKN